MKNENHYTGNLNICMCLGFISLEKMFFLRNEEKYMYKVKLN